VPAKTSWFSHLSSVIAELEASEDPFVDTRVLQKLLGVGPRRAQQILQPLISRTLGRNGLAPKPDVIRHLRGLADSDAAHYEIRRRDRLHAILDSLHQRMTEQPRVMVEAPADIVSQALDHLPRAIQLTPGSIRVEGFQSPDEAKQLLLALVMAIGNDPDAFDERIRPR
jgi:hypothetical protein